MSQQSLTTFALIALMAVAFYFLILRPQKKRQQQQQKTMSSITPGARVMTGSGVFGTVMAVGEKQIVIETSPGVTLTLLKPAVSKVVGPEDEDGPALDEDFDAETHYEPQPSSLDLLPKRSDPATPTGSDPGIDRSGIDRSGIDAPGKDWPPNTESPRGSAAPSAADPYRAEDLGPSATDVTPGTQTPGNDPSTKE